MTFGGNAQLKTIYHKKERELIQSYLSSFKVQLKETSKYGDRLTGGSKSYRWTELNSKIDFCNKLLGKI